MEYAYSASQFTTEKVGFDLGLVGKVVYGLLNITYGNSLDELVEHKGER